MALQVYKFTEIVSNIAAAVQASATALVGFKTGSTLLAIAEATAGVVLWLQAIILQLLTLTRASTSNASDLDSWMADYALTRLPAVAASGQVTFSRFTASQQALIPAGSRVQSADGTQTFAVAIDTANSAWNPAQNGYVLLANTASVTVPVMALVAGSGGNVQANTLTVITTPIPGVDTATNASAFSNGIDAESDAAFRLRFVLYLASLSKATKVAIGYAVSSIRQGIDSTITENEDYDGTPDNGFFYVVIDSGTGYPSTDLLNSASAAIEAVRGLTIRYAVYAPVVETANVSMILATDAHHDHAAVVAAVAIALRDFIDGLKLGVSLPYTQLAGIAYSIPGVTNASGILLNGGTADLAATKRQKINAGTISVS